MAFDHDKLDLYRLSIEYVADSFRTATNLSGLHRHARDQWLHAVKSVPWNIAESPPPCDAKYEYEYRFAEYEHDAISPP